ncbi:hypothetical protein E3N88_24803 [Mikania micrantha]|uniref:DOG1 domain-containing protein n=1 Tax=Mikania micrantha TaxID=192012 RepID=A0A5N6N2Z0_9ASTR|nr:hypothetical protein E3N88_24803 [Mikania micrantha]
MHVDRKKPPAAHRPFSDYYSDWITTMKTTHLPNLRLHMSSASPSLLSAHVEIIHHHFNSYYHTLDLAVSGDVSQILFPSGQRNAVELPFLWLGDLHPYVFTNLLRSYLHDPENEPENDPDPDRDPEYEDNQYDHQEHQEHEEDDEEIEVGESCEFLKKQWPLMNAWKIQSRKLTTRIDQIERGLRLMVPALMNRVRKAQAGFVQKVGSGEVTPAMAAAEMEEEMVGIVMDANRLRKDVISEIVSVTSVYQAALFLEGLAQFLVGIRDGKLLQEFKKCKSLIR